MVSSHDIVDEMHKIVTDREFVCTKRTGTRTVSVGGGALSLTSIYEALEKKLPGMFDFMLSRKKFITYVC